MDSFKFSVNKSAVKDEWIHVDFTNTSSDQIFKQYYKSTYLNTIISQYHMFEHYYKAWSHNPYNQVQVSNCNSKQKHSSR
jgi:hypothetical protein